MGRCSPGDRCSLVDVDGRVDPAPVKWVTEVVFFNITNWSIAQVIARVTSCVSRRVLGSL